MDARDRLISITDAANQGTGHATTFAYDGMNLISETDPDGDTTTFAYDGQNRLIGETDALGHPGEGDRARGEAFQQDARFGIDLVHPADVVVMGENGASRCNRQARDFAQLGRHDPHGHWERHRRVRVSEREARGELLFARRFNCLHLGCFRFRRLATCPYTWQRTHEQYEARRDGHFFTISCSRSAPLSRDPPRR